MVAKYSPSVVPNYDPYGGENNIGSLVYGDVRTELDVDVGRVAGHLSTAEHTHVHWHLNELYFCGSEGVISGVNEIDQDFIIRNPSGSGKTVEMIQYKITTSVGYDTKQYYNATYPTTSGSPDGTEITPFNLKDHSINSTFEVQHTPAADSTDLVDETTADRQVPAGIVGASKQNPTPASIENATIGLNPGETMLYRTDLDGTNEDVAYLALVAEYEQGREI